MTATCPSCHNEVQQPIKIWSVASELDQKGGFSEKRIALYVCERCQTKFPIVAGSKRFRIVHEAELALLKKKASEGEELTVKVREMNERIQLLTSELEGLKRDLELERLRNRRDDLHSEVEYLKEIKRDFQEKLAKLQGEDWQK
jgi:FtsZ-binding cell division protein ZapB